MAIAVILAYIIYKLGLLNNQKSITFVLEYEWHLS